MADFYFLNPGKYGARLINDTNGNGEWDTGDYAKGQQPEAVYYYPNILEYKALWDTTQNWDIHATPVDKQKPDELKKQKPDEDKERKIGNKITKTAGAASLRRNLVIGLVALFIGCLHFLPMHSVKQRTMLSSLESM